MKIKAKFTIPGEPQGKGRPRFVGTGRKPITPEKTAVYENLVKLEYQRQCHGIKFPDESMIDMRITAYYEIPKSASKKKRTAMLNHKIRPTKKPDIDNVFKVVADSLNGLAYHDDSQIVDGMVRKFYSDEPRVVVTIQNSAEVY